MEYPKMRDAILAVARKASDDKVGAGAMIALVDAAIAGEIAAVARQSEPDVVLAFLLANPDALDWKMDHEETRFADQRFQASYLGIGGIGSQRRRPIDVHESAIDYLADLLRGKIRGDLNGMIEDLAFRSGKPLRQMVLDLHDIAYEVAAVDKEMKFNLSQLKGDLAAEIRTGNFTEETVRMTVLMIQILRQWHDVWWHAKYGPEYRSRLEDPLASRFAGLLPTVMDAIALYYFSQRDRLTRELAGDTPDQTVMGAVDTVTGHGSEAVLALITDTPSILSTWRPRQARRYDTLSDYLSGLKDRNIRSQRQ